MLRLTRSFLLLLWALPQVSVAQDNAHALRRNLTSCLSGLGLGCDKKLLTPEQEAQVRDASLRRNYRACVSGLGSACNETLLTPEQRADARDAALRRNYRACVTGLGSECKETALTPEQRADVRDAALRRNYKACVSGLGFGCDEKLLTPDQSAGVRAGALRRNYRACVGGRKFGCDERLLKPEQTAEVRDAALHRNYLACVSVLRLGCNEGLLTPAEGEEVQAAAQKQAEKLAELRALVRREGELAARWRVASEYNGAAFNCDPMAETEIAPIIDAAAQANQMEAKLLRGVIEQESAYHACAVSPKGAMGLMQLMPATAQQFGVANPFDARQNIDAGARFLKQLMERYNGDLSLALAAYNAGPGTVDQATGIPDIRETKDYVDSVLKKVR